MTFKDAFEAGADFMPNPSDGIIYHIQEYKRIKEFGLPNIYGGIRVSQDGKYIGVVEESTLEEMGYI